MIKTEFGIIDDFNEKNDYTGYYPDKYNCVAIDDDRYISAFHNTFDEHDNSDNQTYFNSDSKVEDYSKQ